MNAHNTNAGSKTPARRTGPPVTAGQWWKAWVLLTGLGATVLGWMTLPGSAYFRRKTPLRIVFKWLGPLSGTPVPDFDVEEGYTEGVR